MSDDPVAPEARWRAVVSVLGVAVVAAVVFAPAIGHGFVNFDDRSYVVDNDVVRRGLHLDGVRWAFTTWTLSNYHPLTWLAHMLDVTLWGVTPAGHHAVSVGWHAVNAALVVILMHRLSGQRGLAIGVALLWALHPLRVESVAWISERKDLLSGFFFLVCLLAWIEGRRRRRDALLVIALVAFVLGLLAKSMLVTVPPLLVVLEVLVLSREAPPSRAARGLLALAFVVTVGFAVLTTQTQSDAMMPIPLLDRVAGAPVNLWRYVTMTAWPTDLAAIYPVERGGPSAFAVVVAVAGLVLVSGVALAVRGRSALVLAGWLWFLGMLVPVSGVIQVGRAAVADRYTYLPHLGLFLAVGVGLDLARRRRPAVVHWRVAPVVLVILAVACVPATIDQISIWRDSRTLFTATTTRAPGSAFAHDALAGELLEDGERDAAFIEARTAVTLAPDVPRYQERLARILIFRGDLDEADRVLRAVLARHPDHASSRFTWSALLRQQGRLDEALAALRQAAVDAAATGDVAFAARLNRILASQPSEALPR